MWLVVILQIKMLSTKAAQLLSPLSCCLLYKVIRFCCLLTAVLSKCLKQHLVCVHEIVSLTVGDWFYRDTNFLKVPTDSSSTQDKLCLPTYFKLVEFSTSPIMKQLFFNTLGYLSYKLLQLTSCKDFELVAKCGKQNRSK